MKIAFVWFGMDGRYGKWKDGLWAAMKHIEKEHEVRYFEPKDEALNEFKPDWVLFWEAPCCINGPQKEEYLWVCHLPYKKALLFAGGPVRSEWMYFFDHIFVESQINADECEVQGLPHSTAFGVNEELFVPMQVPKLYDGMMHATFADWKRFDLLAKSLGNKCLAVGRLQEFDRNGYNECLSRGVTVKSETYSTELVELINSSHTVVNTSNAQGGGQRCTLEGMACDIPVIVMSDSPKNCEFVRESGYGLIVEPNEKAIREAVEKLKNLKGGRDYIMSKWTSHHYADAILKHLT